MIIDDEPPAQRVVEKFVSQIPYLQLIAKCKDVFDASAYLHAQKIDLIFLDINMPKMSGIDFLRSLNPAPMVIITTAYHEYAIEGYELNVTDYLLKPFSFERFFQAVNKVSKALSNTNEQVVIKSDLDKKNDTDDFIFVREDKVNFRVLLSEILYLESVGDYVKVHTTNRTYLVYQTLKNIEKQLKDDNFIRVHKSFIVPFPKIDSIEGNSILIGKQFIPIGTTYRKDFFDAMQKFRLL